MTAVKLDLIQNSPEWLAARKTRIGSSDAPAIMGVSPWQTQYELWLSKLGLTPFKKPKSRNYAIELGHRFEPAARALYELLTGLEFPALTLRRDDICPQIASLDGWNSPNGIVLEIKCVQGGPTWEKACRGELPENYKPQVYHQMIVADATEAHFVVFKLGKANGTGQLIIEDHRVIIVKRDASYERDLMIAEKGFYEMWQKKISPPLSKDDTFVADDQSTVLLFSRLKAKKKQLQDAALASEVVGSVIADLKNEFEEIKEEAIEHCEHEIKHCKVHAVGVNVRKDKNGVWSVTLNENETAYPGDP